MTVLGGVRPMATGHAMPAGAIRLGSRSAARTMAGTRRRLSRPDRAGRRVHPIGVLLALIMVAFLVGLLYLAQTIQLGATNYEIEQLIAQREDLHRQLQTTETGVLRWGTEPTVLERAQRLGLDPLPTRIRLIAR